MILVLGEASRLGGYSLAFYSALPACMYMVTFDSELGRSALTGLYYGGLYVMSGPRLVVGNLKQ